MSEVRVIESPRPNGEVWYRVLVDGRDREAEWADPDAARAWGEKVAAENAARMRGGTVETIERPEEEPKLPEEVDVPTPPGIPEPGTTEPEPDDDDDETDADRNRKTVEDGED